MMKHDHEILTIKEAKPTPPRLFSSAFYPINLVAAEVTRLKLPLPPRFDDLPAFVPIEINLIRLNPAKKLFGGAATPCRHNRPLPPTCNVQRATCNQQLGSPASRPPIGRPSIGLGFVIQLAGRASALSYFKLF